MIRTLLTNWGLIAPPPTLMHDMLALHMEQASKGTRHPLFWKGWAR